MTTDARLAQLEATVDDLRRELERLRTQRRLPMRQTHRCPACGSTPILHFTSVTDLSYGGPTGLALKKTFSQWRGRVISTVGPLEAYVCRGCLLVEWHAGSLDVSPDGTTVIELLADDAPDPASSPYR